jgi:hypothetical protein
LRDNPPIALVHVLIKTIEMNPKMPLGKPMLLTALLLLLAGGLFAQTKPNKEVLRSRSNQDATYSIRGVEKGKQKVPEALGGGKAPSHSLMISSANWRGGKEITPEALGAENLLPARWLDKEHFLFLATDAVDIQDYYIYVSSNEAIYRCKFGVGEEIGYGDFPEGTRFSFQIVDSLVVGFETRKE